MRTETKAVFEPTVIPSATNLENQMPDTHDSSEPTLVPGTDETQDRESPDMETDDPDTTVTVPEPPPVVQLVPPPPLPQHRIYGKREAAVVHERSVRPRIELPEEDELCLCTVSRRVFESKFRNMSAITESKGLELALSLRILWVKISKQRPKMTVICIVFLMIKVLNSHLTCHGTI